MDITTVIGTVCAGIVFLAWFVLPHTKTVSSVETLPAELPKVEVTPTAEPISLTA
jgi:predicted secreted protein